MKLQAVTICFYYSHYLECILQNRAHFDRWLILTAPDDWRTQELCSAHGIEWISSQLLESDEHGFDAAWNKARYINEALNALEPTGWALILDSDVHLPRHFRRRLEAMPLEKGCVYGLKGRRACRDRRSFQALREFEPWEHWLQRNTQPLGYFNLFDLESLPHRYPELPVHRGRIHDDNTFTDLFPPSARRLLPMSALHIGSTGVNWKTSASNQSSSNSKPLSARVPSGELSEFFDSNLPQGFTAAVVGDFPGNAGQIVAQKGGRLYWVDQHRIHHRSSDPLIEADRVVLRACVEAEIGDGENVRVLTQQSWGGLAAIPDCSLNLLYLAGGDEDVCETLIDTLSLWLPKLKDDAIICGQGFIHSIWPEGVTAITSLLGRPDHVWVNGFWWKRLVPKLREQHARSANQRALGGDGVIIVNANAEDLEPLFLSIHSVREHWNGAIAVYHRGDEEASLRLACWRFGCELHHLGEAVTIPPDGSDLLSIVPIHPFRRALLLRSGMLLEANPAPLFTEAAALVPVNNFGPYLCDSIQKTCHSLAPTRVTHCAMAVAPAAVLVCEGNSRTWSDSAWEAWSDRKARLAEEIAVEVAVNPDATIVFVADSDAFGDLQHRWPTMRFPAQAKTMLILRDVSPEDVWLPGDRQPSSVLHLSDQDQSVSAVLATIVENCSTERIVFLPPTASAIAGAELFLSPEWNAYDAVLHTPPSALDEPLITGNVFVPTHFFGMVRASFLQEVVVNASESFEDNLAVFLQVAIAASAGRCCTTDLRVYGWHIPDRFTYVRKSLLPAGTDGVASLWKAGTCRMPL